MLADDAALLLADEMAWSEDDAVDETADAGVGSATIAADVVGVLLSTLPAAVFEAGLLAAALFAEAWWWSVLLSCKWQGSKLDEINSTSYYGRVE